MAASKATFSSSNDCIFCLGTVTVDERFVLIWHVRENVTQFVVCSALPVDLSLMRLRAVLHDCEAMSASSRTAHEVDEAISEESWTALAKEKEKRLVEHRSRR